jgi:hypothetical protein
VKAAGVLTSAYPDGTSHTGQVPILEDFRIAARGLGEHPQDHGWRDLYRLFSHGLDGSAPNLTATVMSHHSARPTLMPRIRYRGNSCFRNASEQVPLVVTLSVHEGLFLDRIELLNQLAAI